MKAKVIIILSTVAVLHLVLGGMFLTGGCAPEDPPMPPGIYVPQPAAKAAPAEDVSTEFTGPDRETDELKLQLEQKDPEPLTQELPPPPEEKSKPAEKTPEPKNTAPVLTDKDTTYVVQKGDSLWKIARVYGISVAELAAYNNIAPSKPIRIGQKLVIPAGSKAVKTQKPVEKKTSEKKVQKKAKGKTAGKVEKAPIPADGIYIVKEGDSFSKIAAKYGLKVSAIAAANPGVSSNRLQIGQKLNLPTAGTAAAPTAKDRPAEKATPTTPAENKQTPLLDEELLLQDIQNPDTVAPPEAAPKAESAPAAEPAAPAADTPLASEDAVKTVTEVNAPATDANVPAALDDATFPAVPSSDTTIDALAAQYGVSANDIKVLNPQLPADGKIKAGTVVKLP